MTSKEKPPRPGQVGGGDECTKDDIPHWNPFPTASLPEPLCSFIKAGASAMQCDESFLALPVLSVIATVIGATRCMQLHPGWNEACILWTAIVGESGTLKTAALRKAVRPLQEIQAKALTEHAERMSQFESEHAAWERNYSAWKRGKANGDPPIEPNPPAPARILVKDITWEGLAPTLRDNWRGVLLYPGELSGWIGGFDRYSSARGGDVAHWLDTYTAESVLIDRKTSGTINVPRAHVCITGGIQPEILRRALGTEHFQNGLAARLLLALPPRQARRWCKHGLPPEHEARYALLIERLRELQPETIEGQSEPISIRLDIEAEHAWAAYYERHNREQILLHGAIASAWSKLEGGAARLALVIHLLRWAAGEPVSESHVDRTSMAAGIVLADWFKAETRRVYVALHESDDAREIRQWCEVIKRKGGNVTVREWQRIRSLQQSDDATAELKRLEAAGCGTLQSVPQKGPGRPSWVFTIFPDHSDTDKIHAGTTESANSSASEMSDENWGVIE